jgi:hypothetical protein
MPISTALCWNVPMESSGVFIHGSLHTQLTILKSMYLYSIASHDINLPFRVLISLVRDGGACPCPQCTIPKTEIRRVGTDKDRQQRSKLLRVDDSRVHKLIQEARDLIYHEGYAVNSAKVEELLKPESLVP